VLPTPGRNPRSDIFRVLSESRSSGAPLSLEVLFSADDLIQEVKSLNTELIAL